MPLKEPIQETPETPAEPPAPFTVQQGLEQLNTLSLDDEGEGPAPAPAGEPPAGQPASGNEEEDPLDYPAHWPKEHREAWTGTPRNLQQFYLDRNREMEAAHTRRSQELAPVRQLVDQWTPFVESFGGDTLQVLNEAMQTIHQLRSGTNAQRLRVLYDLGRAFGVDYTEGQQQADPAQDPFGLRTMVAESMRPLQQQVHTLAQQHSGQQQATEQQQMQVGLRALENFKSEKDADGNLKHPHYDEVLEKMISTAQARRIATGRPLSPEDIAPLYEEACWAVPSVRSKLIASQKAGNSDNAKRGDQGRQRRARSAAGGLSGGGGERQVEQPTDVRGALAQNLERLRSAS